jgi:hypothetical protein
VSFDIGKTSAEQLGAQAAIATQQEQQGSERGNRTNSTGRVEVRWPTDGLSQIFLRFARLNP